MNVYNNFDEIDYNKNSVLTVGTFDGVHKGHKVILNRLLEIGKTFGLRPVLLTIHPHPQMVIQKDFKEPIKILTTINERIELFKSFGIPNLLIIPFTYEFSQTPPEIFVREYLNKYIGMKRILIGYDHMFGKNREGDENLLQRLSSELDFSVEKIDAYQDQNLTVSSTKIRNAIKSADLKLANEMLGYDYSVTGNVEIGDKRGRTIGYPTANIGLKYPFKLLPPNGIYLVQSTIYGKKFFGMCNLGTRPTFKDDNILTLEVYYLDFDMDIYGNEIKVEFIQYIREEKKFSSKEDLITEIKNDEIICRNLIENL